MAFRFDDRTAAEHLAAARRFERLANAVRDDKVRQELLALAAQARAKAVN